MSGLHTGSGTQFNFSYAPGVTTEQIIGFEMAGDFWSQQLSDNVTINLFVEMTDYLPKDVIGGALPAIEDNISYSTYRNNLQQDITSDIDTLVNQNQQNDRDKFTAYFDAEYSSNGYYKVDNNEYMKMTSANAKALNIIDPHDTGLDGYILMRNLDGVGDGSLNNVRWSYNYESDVIDSNSLDFLSVAIHEVGHALGFISGLDEAGWLAEKLEVNAQNEDDYYNSMVGNLNNATPMDMLRFSSESTSASGSGDSWIDMSIGGNPYLSFNGGQTTVAYFSTGENRRLGGDGNQASHWKEQEEALGIMDPILRVGQRREISELDTKLFDAIGWDLKTENSGDTDISIMHTQAKQKLAAKITINALENQIYIDHDALAQWVQTTTNDQTTTNNLGNVIQDMLDLTITRNFIDSNGGSNGLDDRGEALNEMITNSGEVYEWGWQGYWWGWQGYWWGWQGYWWGWQGYWQSNSDFKQDGFWQNFSFQTIELSDTSLLNTESSNSETTDILVNIYLDKL